MKKTSKAKVLAILCSDLHLSHTAPRARSGESSWYRAMGRVLRELDQLQTEHDCPILFAGDLFDKPHQPPEMINWAIEHMPQQFYAIPGQHDLLHHSYREIEKTAYWTLVHAKAIEHLSAGPPLYLGDFGLSVFAFPWSHKLQPCQAPRRSELLRVCVAHRYVWIKGKKHAQAASSDSLTALKTSLKGFDVAVFGDNHQSFIRKQPKLVVNCGTMMRRKLSEVDYTPAVYLLTEERDIVPVPLDTSEDVLEDLPTKLEQEVVDFSHLLTQFKHMATDPIDFKEALFEACASESRKEVAQIIKAAIAEAMQ